MLKDDLKTFLSRGIFTAKLDTVKEDGSPRLKLQRIISEKVIADW